MSIQIPMIVRHTIVQNYRSIRTAAVLRKKDKKTYVAQNAFIHFHDRDRNIKTEFCFKRATITIKLTSKSNIVRLFFMVQLVHVLTLGLALTHLKHRRVFKAFFFFDVQFDFLLSSLHFLSLYLLFSPPPPSSSSSTRLWFDVWRSVILRKVKMCIQECVNHTYMRVTAHTFYLFVVAVFFSSLNSFFIELNDSSYVHIMKAFGVKRLCRAHLVYFSCSFNFFSLHFHSFFFLALFSRCSK